MTELTQQIVSKMAQYHPNIDPKLGNLWLVYLAIGLALISGASVVIANNIINSGKIKISNNVQNTVINTKKYLKKVNDN